MADYKISFNRHCPCLQKDCPIRGNCVLCIQRHLDHKRHIPECIQNLLRPAVKALADHMELKTTDSRPDEEFWKTYDKDGLVNRALEPHKDSKK